MLKTYRKLSECNESFTTNKLRDDFDIENPQAEAEGIVIEPVTPHYLSSCERVYLKKENKTFFRERKK